MVLGADQDDAAPGGSDRGLPAATESQSDTDGHLQPHPVADSDRGETEGLSVAHAEAHPISLI
jgi:hypothetical protein